MRRRAVAGSSDLFVAALGHSGSIVTACRFHKVPLGGLSDEWLKKFVRATRSRSSGKSNDPIIDAKQRSIERESKKRKGKLAKGLPSASQAKTLDAKLKTAHDEKDGKGKKAPTIIEPRRASLVASTAADDKRQAVQGEVEQHALEEVGDDHLPVGVEPSPVPSLLTELPVDADGGPTLEAHAINQERTKRAIHGDLVQVSADPVDLDPSKYELDHSPVVVNSTVGASELDEVESRYLQSLKVRVSNLPRDLFDQVYDRKSSLPPSSLGTRRVRQHEASVPEISSARQQRKKSGGVNYARWISQQEGFGGREEVKELAAEDNPHFPVEPSPVGNSSEQATTPSTAPVKILDEGSANQIDGDDGAVSAQAAADGAYFRRPVNHDLVPRTMGTDVWVSTSGPSHQLEESANAYDASHAADRMAEGPMDCYIPEFNAEATRQAHLRLLSKSPINEMIQEPYCRIQLIEPRDGSKPFSPSLRGVIPTSEARVMARNFGLDLIRSSTEFRANSSTQVVAVCIIGDHREQLRRDVTFRLAKQGVNAPPSKPLIDMAFRGGTHPFAIRHKIARVVKQLVRGAPARITLTDFGTPHEGFPVFQSILDEVMRQSNSIKAFHRASPITATYDEIACFLIPTTAKAPKSSVVHPTSRELEDAKKKRVLEEQKEIHFEGYYGTTTSKDRTRYAFKIDNGTAWAEQDEGLSLRDQRRLKIFQGFLPKGNKDLYSQRGDVNVPFPFKTNHITTMDKWNYGRETNLDQVGRAAAVLGKRRQMPISEMHDLGETEDNPSTVDKFHYRMSGEALDVGSMKEALGLKNNRKRAPMPAGPWGTLGSPNTEESPFHTVK